MVVDCCLFCVGYCCASLDVVCCLLFDEGCSLLVVCCSLCVLRVACFALFVLVI